ncbi:MAG: class I SAM-dependent methyltransferase [Taibaiella sp.]|jgi:SAM-dependent methyltransferase
MKEHWENIFTNKQDNQKSWFEDYPAISMQLITEQNLDKDAAIIDIGGGDSHLVDALIAAGYTNITVLDISEKALDNARVRLGKPGDNVKWIVADICTFIPEEKYDLWHDRAVFHFLTGESEREQYIQTAQNALTPGSKLIIGTFSLDGPEKCSNLPVQRYNVPALQLQFKPRFLMEKGNRFTHITPFQTTQSFTFCVFRAD